MYIRGKVSRNLELKTAASAQAPDQAAPDLLEAAKLLRKHGPRFV